jgi:hypothetical protein
MLTDTETAALRRLLDLEAIRDCNRRYTRGVDRHDDELIASAFWPDAQINYANSFSGQTQAFIDWANHVHGARYVRHHHNITNQTIDLDGDVAHTESYVVWFLRAADKTGGAGAGRYIERVERRGTEWRIAQRELIVDILYTLDCSPFDEDRLGPIHGRWDREDISYARPMPRREG